MGVALVLLVYALTAFDFGGRAGVAAALVLGTCLQQIVLAHAAVTDMTLAATLLAGLYGVRRWLAAPEGRARLGWALLAGAMVGLATLAKGPVAMILVALTVGIHLGLTRRLRRLLSADAVLAVLAALLVAGPWFLAMYLLHAEQFVQGFLVANNVTRFLTPEHARVTGHWYSYFLNVPTLLFFFLPWTFFLPPAVAREARANEGARLALTWAAVVFVFFSLSKTQLTTYIFPLFPALALLVGAWWAELGEQPAGRSGLRWALVAGTVGAALLVPGLYFGAHRLLPGEQWTAAALGGMLLVAFAVALGGEIAGGAGKSRPGRPGRGLWVVAGMMVVFTFWLVSVIMPLVSPLQGLGPLLAHLPADPSARVIAYHLRRPSLVYYGGPRLEYLDRLEQIRPLLAGDRPVIVLCENNQAGPLLGPGVVVLAREGRWEMLSNLAGPGTGGK
jgi:4-amino-4-deoxy-L-arabinose transferase-like glycosyltransferase